MYRTTFLMIFAAILGASGAQAKTLIVTHPEPIFDNTKSAGPAIQDLLVGELVHGIDSTLNMAEYLESNRGPRRITLDFI